MTPTIPTFELVQAGQSPWLDQISRKLLDSGRLESFIKEDGLLGVTSNPSIFEKAISEPGGGYDKDIRKLPRRAKIFEIYDSLTLADIRRACDLFLPVFKTTHSEHGFVSLEVAPGLAHETEATICEAHRLFRAVARPNVMIKVPATPEGIPAVRKLIAGGVNINITLMFSLKHYQDVAHAYLDGLRDFLAQGGNLSRVHSVASVFVSRIDTLVDKKLEALAAKEKDTSKRAAIEALKGKAAVANSKLIYQEFKKILASKKFQDLQAKGATIQKVLWGSTSTKNPTYPDLLYVETMVGRETVNTMPLATLEAFLDHGSVRANTVEEGLDEAHVAVRQLGQLGIDLEEVGEELQRQGVQAFCDSFDGLMRTLEIAREPVIGKKKKPASVKYFLGSEKISKKIDDKIAALEKENFHPRFLARDPKLWQRSGDDPAAIAARLGWLGAADWALGKLVNLDLLTDFVHLDKIKDIVLLGMGGSSLGAEVLAHVMKKPAQGPRFHVLDTTDPATILKLEKQIKLKSAQFIVASKSGSTIETVSQFSYFYERVRKAYGKSGSTEKIGRHFIAVTDAGSSLEKLAREKKFRKIFINPADIGGRYSVLSFFGLVPAVLMGVDVRPLLASARAFENHPAIYPPSQKTPALAGDECEGRILRSPAVKDWAKEDSMLRRIPPTSKVPRAVPGGLHLGVVLAELAESGRDKLTFWTTRSLASFGAWLEQLVAESTGKEGKGIVPVEGESPGRAADYGKDRVFVVAKLKGDSQGNFSQKVRALKKAGFPVIECEWPDRETLGAEFLLWEIATAIAGAMLGINPFDEPNVQESKDNTARILEELKKTGKLPVPKNPPHLNPLPHRGRGKGEGMKKRGQVLTNDLSPFFSKVRQGGYIALLAYTERSGKIISSVNRIRQRIAKKFRVPVLVGFGPRYLHSIGQLYKGGPPTGLFIEFLPQDSKDIVIPQAGYSFGSLKRAQALGDFQALEKRGLPVLLVDLGKDPEKGLQAFETELVSYFACEGH